VALDRAGLLQCAKVASGEIKVKNGKIAAFRGNTLVFKDIDSKA
jgi:hypothetical protein